VSPEGLIVVGGGEHARVVLEAARSCPERWTILGYVAPQVSPETEARFSIRWLGDDAAVLATRAKQARFIIGVGSTAVTRAREELAARYDEAGVSWATVIHERAIVSTDARVEAGVLVAAGAVINGGASVGRHCIVNTGAIVEHDAAVEELTHVGPGAILGGGARIGAGSYLGLGSRIRDHIALGARVLVAMGAVVVADVGDDDVVLGVPARSSTKRRP
jgi:acetyltransferase EpsM